MTYVPNSGLTKQYISNPGAESGVTGATAYADAAGSIPVDGIGGSPTLTVTRTTTNPLRGLAGYLVTKDAANRQGEGFSIPFSIDRADRGQVLQISADMEVMSGTYDSGTSTTNSDLIVYIYDVTNARLIEPAGMKVMQGFKVKATFQTSIDSQSYRLIFHQSLTGTSAYTVQLDNISVSPQVTASGYSGNDFTSAGPITITGSSSNPTKGTTTIDRVMWRKEGDHARIRYEYRQTAAGTAGSGTYYFAIPSAIGTIDTAKQTVGTNSAASWVQTTGGADQNGSSGFFVQAFAVDATKVALLTLNAVGGSPSLSNIGSSYWAMNQTSKDLSFEIVVPIQGWSSNTVVSSETDTRVVALSATNSGGSITTSVTALTSNWTTVVDTHGGFSSGVYTVKVPGIYRIKFSCGISGSSASIVNFIQVNGSDVVSGSDYTANTTYVAHPIAEYVTTLKVGDTVGVRTLASVGGSTYAPLTSLIIERLSGPAQITATESVSASYYVSSGSSTTAANPYNFDTKVWDTHNAVTTGSSWKFTAPVSGQYEVTASMHAGATTTNLYVYKNGSAYRYIDNTTSSDVGNGTCKVSLLAGEYVDVRPQTTSTPTAPSGGTLAQVAWVEVTRTGNYV